MEQVSFHDVERFLGTLRGQLRGGAEPVLPTEAQWEYACRAGTTTAYAFGAQVTRQQVNFESQGTVPVKSLPPNPWGLYEVHGNVWEWCADDWRSYVALAAGQMLTDPLGPQEGGLLVVQAVRGGSWDSRPGGARSAFRSRLQRGFRDQNQGFRLVLRSQA